MKAFVFHKQDFTASSWNCGFDHMGLSSGEVRMNMIW